MASADFEGALVALGQLIGLIDKNTGINFPWFGDPAQESLQSIPANRDQIGVLFAALTGATAPSAAFPGGAAWTWSPIQDGDLSAGIAWTAPVTPAPVPPAPSIEVGFGAADGGVSVLAKLFSESGTAGSYSAASELGQFVLNLPTPSFLTSASVQADVLKEDLSLNLASSQGTQSFELLSTKNKEWDAVRLALFILRSWISQAAGSLSATDLPARIEKHLFALLGDPAGGNAIGASPLVAGVTAVPPAGPFLAWAQSVISTGQAQVSTALSFLWHIRALLTGDETASVLKAATGAFYIPLTGTGGATGAPSALPATVNYPPNQAGAWIGIAPAAAPLSGFNLVLSIQTGASGAPFELPLVNLSGSTVTLPAVPSASLPNLTTCLNALKAAPLSFAHGQIGASLSAGVWTVPLFSQQLTVPDPNGKTLPYTLGLGLTINASTGAIGFAPVIPIFSPLELPPTATTVKTAFVNILTWLANTPQVTQTKFGKVASDAATLAGNLILGTPADPAPILIDLTTAILPLSTTQNPPVLFSTAVKGNDTILTAAVNVGPIDAGSSSTLPVHIGTLGAHVDIDLGSDSPGAPAPAHRFYGFGFSFTDLRLGDQSGGGSDLIGSLIPDLNKLTGFYLSVGWTAVSGIDISGGGTVSIQKTLGPFDIGALTVAVKDNTTIKIGIDLTFSLGPITVSAEDLGFQLGLGKGPTLPPFLQGLGLSMTTDFINLSGMFGSVGSDYVGGVSVSVADMFQLSAIGGYTKASGQPSLFIFASLVAPLGGTPFMFITGVAGGFGYNRKLPPTMPLDKHPFLQVMSGDLPLTGNLSNQLEILSKQDFPVQVGEYWVAGGIQFISFGLIHGKVIVAVAFGNNFSLQLIGAASFSLGPVAYFEIDIAVTVDEQKFLLVASLSPNSYVIDKGLLSLRGDFALGVWHSGPDAGDFVLSIGGYHPYYTKPDYYPSLNRVGVKAHIDLGLTIDISVEGFFALTTQAMMAGASASISASILGISAGLDVYVDVFIQWDPFFIMADLGVTVWFVFFGRHEIGVDLSIHTPTFGGTATIHLFIVSFSFSFGSPLMQPPPPSVTDFSKKNLQIASAVEKKGAANVPALNSGAKKGLLHPVVTQGCANAGQAGSSSAPDGTDPNNPILVNAGLFTVTVNTLMPFVWTGKTETAGKIVVNGTNDLALCQDFTNYSTLTVTWSSNPTTVAAPHIGPNYAWYPVAQFGTAIEPIQGDGARQHVAQATKGSHVVSLCGSVNLEYFGEFSPATPPAYNEAKIDESIGNEIMPLPLKAQQTRPVVHQLPPSAYNFSTAATSFAVNKRQVTVGAALSAEAAAERPTIVPVGFSSLTATWVRPAAAGGVKHTSVKAPAGVATIAAPVSPARRDELAAVSLQILPARTTAPRRIHIRVPILVPITLRKIVKPGTGAAGTYSTTITVPNGQSVHTAITGSTVTGGTLTATGAQPLRAILLGYGERPMSDSRMTALAATSLPRGVRSVFLIGEEPVVATAPVGAEKHCTLLALGRRIFAGNGCIVESNIPLPTTYHPLDSVPAADVLPNLMNATLYFGTPAPTATLVLTVRQQGAAAASATESVRWRSLTATLGALTMIAGAGVAAFAMPVTARGAWNLEIDLGTGWTLDGAVVTPEAAATVAAGLKGSANWNLVDDRFAGNPAAGDSTVMLEVKQ